MVVGHIYSFSEFPQLVKGVDENVGMSVETMVVLSFRNDQTGVQTQSTADLHT